MAARCSQPAVAARTALTYALWIGVVQVLWIGFLFVPDGATLPVFLVLMLAELAVPDIAERNGTTPWHAHHTTAIEPTIPA